MKKLFLAALTVFLGSTAMAQVNFFQGTLNEAYGQAKADGKKVILLGSATW